MALPEVVSSEELLTATLALLRDPLRIRMLPQGVPTAGARSDRPGRHSLIRPAPGRCTGSGPACGHLGSVGCGTLAKRDPRARREAGAGQAQDRKASGVSGRFRARTPVAW
jgi:hypothetical protein